MHNREITHRERTDSLSKLNILFAASLRETYVKTKNKTKFYENALILCGFNTEILYKHSIAKLQNLVHS